MFRNLFLLLIKAYWNFLPENKRRVCLYKESCSKFVYRVTEQQGLIKGLLSFRDRMKNCDQKYQIIKRENTIQVLTVKGVIIEEKDINPFIIKHLDTITIKRPTC